MNTLSLLRRSTANSTKPTFLARLLRSLAVTKERKHLRSLTRDRLKDIGITRAQAEHEANRAPWDVPSHWKR